MRIDFDEDNRLLRDLAVVACEKAENFLGIHLIQRSMKQVHYDFYGNKVKLLKTPVMLVSQVKGANDKTFSRDEWNFDKDNGTVEFEEEVRGEKIEIHYISGMKDDTSKSIKYGVLEHIAYLYNGQSQDSGIPDSSLDLYLSLRNCKIWR